MKSLGFITTILMVMIIFGGCSKSISVSESKEGQSSGYDTTDYNIIYSDAIRQTMLGNIGDAARLYTRAISINSGSDASYYQLSKLYEAVGDFRNSTISASRAASIDKNNSWYLYNAGVQYYQMGSLDSAIYFFERLLLIEPEREDIKLTLGGFYEQNGDFEKASGVVKDFIEVYGNEPELLKSLINIYSKQGKDDEAEKLLKLLIETGDDIVSNYGLLAEFYKSKNREEEALEIYNKLFGLKPESSNLQLSYTDFLRVSKKYDEFNENLTGVVLSDSIPVEGKINLLSGILSDDDYLAQNGQELEFVALLTAGAYPNNAQMVLLVSQIFDAIGKEERAIVTLRNYCEKNPENYIMWERLMFAYSSGERVDELFDVAKYVSTKFNLYPVPKLLLAYAAIEKKEYELAVSELNKAITLSNGQVEILVEIRSLLANAFYEKGDKERAFSEYEEGLKLDPDNAMLLNNFAYYLAEDNIRLDEAEEMIKKCLGIEVNSTYVDTYAWVLFKRGKIKKADIVMTDLFKKSEFQSADHFEHYGFIKRGLNNCNEAISYWREALERDDSKTHLLVEIEKCGQR